MASRIAPSAAIAANRYMCFSVLWIIATVRRLINSLGGAVCKLSNKSSSIPLVKKYDTLELFRSTAKLAKFAKDFDIPATALTTVSKDKDKLLSCFLSEYTRSTMP